MPKIKIGASILFTKELDRCLEFYTTLGLNLEKEDHGEGPIHYATDIEGVHFAIFQAEKNCDPLDYGSSGTSMLGFFVDDVEATYKKLTSKGFESFWEPKDRPWGRTARVLDPDKRVVEFVS